MFKGTPEFTAYLAALDDQFKRDVRLFEDSPIEIPAIPITTSTTEKTTTSMFINC